MGKYWATAVNSFNRNNAYKANTIIMMFSVLLSFGVLFYFWSSIYRQGNQIGTYSFSQMITYYIFISIFELVFAANTAWSIGEEIKTGQLNSIVLRPIKYLEYKFSQNIGMLLYRMVFLSPIIAVVLFAMRNLVSKPQEKYGYMFFIILSLLAFILNFLIYYLVGVLSFWLVDNTGFYFASFVVISFMQGQWMPLDLLPKWFMTFGNYLPFKYLFFVPVAVASGRSEFDYSMLAVPLVWCVILYVLGGILYKKGIKKYEGYGV